MELDPQAHCPLCQARTYDPEPLLPGGVPLSGDRVVCPACGGVSVFEPRLVGPGRRMLALRVPNAQEQAAIDDDPRTATALLALAWSEDSRAAAPLWRRLMAQHVDGVDGP